MNSNRAFTISAERKSKSRFGADGKMPGVTVSSVYAVTAADAAVTGGGAAITAKNPPNTNKIGHTLINEYNNIYLTFGTDRYGPGSIAANKEGSPRDV